MQRLTWHACGFVSLFASLQDAAFAQSAGRPSPVDPLQIERRIDVIESEQRRANKPPPTIPKLAQPESKGDQVPLFKLESVVVQGATAISREALVEAYRPFLGRKVSQRDLELIASRFSELYRAAGYHLSRAIIPPQDVKSGQLIVRVIEGAIKAIHLTGSSSDRFGVRTLLNPIIDERPSRLTTVERHLLLANDIPGVRVGDIVLDEIGTASGQFRLTVKIETWSIHLGFGLDTWGTFAIGPWQAYQATSFNSYGVPGDALSVLLSTVPDAWDDLRYLRAAYDVPVGNGSRIGISASETNARPDDSRRFLDTRILTRIYELRGSIVPIATREMSFSLTAALSVVDSSEITRLGTTYNDRVRMASLAANYRFRDWLDGWNYAIVVVRQGLGLFDASRRGDPVISRLDASPHFTVLGYSYTRQQQLSGPWSIKTSVAGQFASGPLLTSQAFYLGGAAFGPGYFSADNGVLANAELRYEQPLNDIITSYQLYGFIDGGIVWNTDDGRQALSSIGVGLRLQVARDLQAGIAFAVPLSYTSRTEEFRDYRLLFSLSNALRVCPERPQMHCT
jgi:hemolysin activation/secretion protein